MLPRQLLAIRNLDKKDHETWDTAGDLLNFPHPFRGVLLGPPNCGKTTTVKNILMRQESPFKRFYVIHCDGEYTQEYDDVEGKLLKDFPQPNEWPGVEKTLVVIDDVELKTLKKHQRMCLDRLFGYVSTHKNISVLLCSHRTPSTCPPSCVDAAISGSSGRVAMWTLSRCARASAEKICVRNSRFAGLPRTPSGSI